MRAPAPQFQHQYSRKLNTSIGFFASSSWCFWKLFKYYPHLNTIGCLNVWLTLECVVNTVHKFSMKSTLNQYRGLTIRNSMKAKIPFFIYKKLFQFHFRIIWCATFRLSVEIKWICLIQSYSNISDNFCWNCHLMACVCMSIFASRLASSSQSKWSLLH